MNGSTRRHFEAPGPAVRGVLVVLAEEFRDSLGTATLDGLEFALEAQIDGRAGRLYVSVRRFEEHDTASEVPRTRRLDSRELELVCEAMRRQIQSGVRLTGVASLVGMSASQLSRSFHATTGMTFSAFLMRLRIRAAMQLMTETNLPLCEIAVASGFGDQSHFSRSFVRFVGSTPFKWRLSNRPESVIPPGFLDARDSA
jgi:transcriptional regulator GlxA family with amidase domain